MVNSATNTPEFECWLDDFFCYYYRHRPVNATFIGVHDYDASLPDYSETGLADTLADMQSMLQQLRQLPPEPLPGLGRRPDREGPGPDPDRRRRRRPHDPRERGPRLRAGA